MRPRLLILLLFLLLGSESSLASSPSFKWAWAYETGDYIRSTPFVAQGLVFVASDDNYLYAL
ncbi:MAG: PQQ-binding-like beta-propeller repeat protein, partial [Anaerolineae bacterium]|nr:PQQ-binding-like beta-propeller repeat protein [Anaerolineae bacterium]